jgi:hypothetical protein
MNMNIPLKSLPIFCLSASVMLFGEVSRSGDSPLELLALVTASVQSRNADVIRDAYAEAARSTLSEPTSKAWNELPRREKLIFSLRLLDGISSCIEKNYVQEEAYINVGAPAGHMSGTAPKHIADPAARKEYERRIAENSQAIGRIRAQSLFQLLKANWTRRVQYLATQNYSKDFDDQAEIKSILDSIVSDESLRIELRQLLGIEGREKAR